MSEGTQAERLLVLARRAISSQDAPRLSDALARLASCAKRGEVTAAEVVDLLERAACLGGPDAVSQVWDGFGGDFAYTGWALALALRCAREDNARCLLALGVDLLGGVRRPKVLRALLPHEGAFTRFDLVRESPTLFVNNMDPTVSTEVFEPFNGKEQLAGAPWAPGTDVAASCRLVARLAEEGLFDPVVFDDLFRAAVVKAWHALRHPREQDRACADACLELGRRMLELHRARGMGDSSMELILGNLVVPKADRRVVAFVCEQAPAVFLGRMATLSWLQDDADLIHDMVPHLSPVGEGANGLLLKLLAKHGFMDSLKAISVWPQTLTGDNLPPAIEAASEAGHAEAAAWLLAQLQQGLRPRKPRRAQAEPHTPIDASATGAAQQAKAAAALPSTPAAGNRDQLALRVLELAQGELISQNPFLAPAAALLSPVLVKDPAAGTGAHAVAGPLFSTDGQSLYVNAGALLARYKATHKAPTQELAHLLVHCLLLHPFVTSQVDPKAWSLSCDIVAEELVAELVAPRDDERSARMGMVREQLSRDFHPGMGAEQIYHHLRKGAYENMRESWSELFLSDDHARWFGSKGGERDDTPADGEPSSEEMAGGQGQGADSSQSGAHGSDYRDGISDGGNDDGGGRGQEPKSSQAPATPDPAAGSSPPLPAQLDETRKRWEQAAKLMRVDLETLSKARGERLGSLMRELEVSSHERVDYREFLRQFAVRSEEMRLSDDEFDYVFYSYGLRLYGDMPLIEPLEYRDERRIRDFALVIDTSSSVTNTVVQQFIDATFDVLTSEASFFERVNIHIIQADMRVQSDTKISSLSELDRWRRNIKLYGMGGTDFRPAFRYVDELLAKGEFDDLSGLIYFTDGWGVYPERVPPYKTTFVFYDEDHRPELVPAWALQITLHPGEFESMSVY